MTLTCVEDLMRLNREVRDLRAGYRAPDSLMEHVDEEYRRYMYGMDGAGYYPWLALAVRILRPARILELGNYNGASTIMIYSELSAECQSFVTVDAAVNQTFVPGMMRSDARMRFVTGNDLDLNIYGEAVPAGCDLLFIDTLHESAHLTDEWAIYQHLCKPGALVVLDDIAVNDMPSFWERCPYPKLDISAECHASGFGIFALAPGPLAPVFAEGSTPSEAILHAYRTALEVSQRRLAETNAALSRSSAPGSSEDRASSNWFKRMVSRLRP